MLAAELGAQTLRQQQLQEENRVLRVRTSALQGNFDDLLSRINWVNDRVNKLAQRLPDKHAKLTEELAGVRPKDHRPLRTLLGSPGLHSPQLSWRACHLLCPLQPHFHSSHRKYHRQPWQNSAAYSAPDRGRQARGGGVVPRPIPERRRPPFPPQTNAGAHHFHRARSDGVQLLC